MSRFGFSLFFLLVLIGVPLQGWAAQTLPGPFSFEVLQVIDGDTFRARVPIWLDQTVTVKIRLSGVDTPEMKGKCPAETARAKLARDFAVTWLQQDDLRLVNVRYGTYAGRVLATAQTAEGVTLSQALLQAELAQPYRGRRAQWCGAAQ
jgi:endonuclease YncB( thermonuclease family)